MKNINRDMNRDWHQEMPILSIIQHNLNDDQLDGLYQAGFDVIDLPNEEIVSKLKQSPSEEEELHELADAILKNHGHSNILCPGGSPAFNAIFSAKALSQGRTLWFSHSVREFKEVVKEDGSVEKQNIFRHEKYIRIEGGIS